MNSKLAPVADGNFRLCSKNSAMLVLRTTSAQQAAAGVALGVRSMTRVLTLRGADRGQVADNGWTYPPLTEDHVLHGNGSGREVDLQGAGSLAACQAA